MWVFRFGILGNLGFGSEGVRVSQGDLGDHGFSRCWSF